MAYKNKINNNADNMSGKPDGISLEIGSATYVDYTRQLTDKSPDNAKSEKNSPLRVYATGKIKTQPVTEIDGTNNKSEFTEKTEEKNSDLREEQLDRQEENDKTKRSQRSKTAKIQCIEAELDDKFTLTDPNVSLSSGRSRNMAEKFTDITPSKKDDKILKKIRKNGIADTVDADVTAEALNTSGNKSLKIQTEIIAGQVDKTGDKKTGSQLRNLNDRFQMGIQHMRKYEEEINKQSERDKKANEEFEQRQELRGMNFAKRR